MHQALRRISYGAVFTLAAAAISTTVKAQEPIEELTERDPCAEYSWDAIPGVESYNLVVMALPDEEEPHPVIDVQLPPSATSWTPTLDGCLEADRNYFWSVRGITPEDDADWLPSIVFRAVTGLPVEVMPEMPPAQPAEEAPPAQPPSGQTPSTIGTIRTLPKPGDLPSGGLRTIGETEKNDTKPVMRPVGPRIPTRQLSGPALEELQRRRLQTAPPKIGYKSEAEANAAAERREREQGQAELDRQQNELERKRREEAAAAAAREAQPPAATIDAVMDLQKLRVQRQGESSGDEYYLVTYKLRGRRGADDRIQMFDYSKQVWPIVAGKNWAKKGMEFTIPRGAGRLTFENLKPFEVYGFVAVLMETNRSTVEEQEYAFGFGEFQNEEGVTETVSGAFDRAIPRTTQMPDYGDTSKQNVQDIVNLNYEGIYRHFGDYRQSDEGLPAAIIDVMYEPLKRSNRDKLDGVIWGFAMNIPGGSDWLQDQPVSALFPPPNGPMSFRTQSTEIIGEHIQNGR